MKGDEWQANTPTPYGAVQVARGLVLPLTVIISFLAFKQLPGRIAFISTGIVFIGFLIGVLFGGGAATVSRCAGSPRAYRSR